MENDNENEEMNVYELNYIRDKIEMMPKFNHVEVLRLLSKNNSVTLNENKNGVHINLTEVSSDIIKQLLTYISYVSAQESCLNHDEIQKENIKNEFFSD